MDDRSFELLFSQPYRIAAARFGVTPSTCGVVIRGDRLLARFGPWRVEAALGNVVGGVVTGPYRFIKTAGPPHLSLADRGLTFATNGQRGACVHFGVPVRGIEPTGSIRHPSLTVTVADCDAMIEALQLG